jgi:hypothetical protein
MLRVIIAAGSLAVIAVAGMPFLMESASLRQESSAQCVQFTQSGPDGAGPRPQTLGAYLNGGVNAIVFGEVQSVEEGPVVGNSGRKLIVGTFDVLDTLKNASPMPKVAAGAFNFGGTFVMKVHQRYILFLIAENPAGLQMVAERAGVPRMRIGASLCVDSADKVHSSTKGRIGVASTALDPVLGPLDGLGLQDALAVIRRALTN